MTKCWTALYAKTGIKLSLPRFLFWLSHVGHTRSASLAGPLIGRSFWIRVLVARTEPHAGKQETQETPNRAVDCQTQRATANRSQQPKPAPTASPPGCYRPYWNKFLLWLLPAKRTHGQHPAAKTNTPNPKPAPRDRCISSLLTAIAGQVSTHGKKEIF